MGRCAKLGRPDCMRLLGYVARGSNCCVRSSAQGWCQPYLGCVRLVRVRRAALLDEAVVARVGNQRRCSLGLKGALQLVGGVGQAGSPVWVPGLALFVVLWRCPTLPQPIGCSTIGAAGLSFQVRNGGWAFPRCYDHHKCWCSTRSPTVLLLFGGGCGLIVVCIVVAAVLLGCCFATRTLVGCCLVLAN